MSPDTLAPSRTSRTVIVAAVLVAAVAVVDWRVQVDVSFGFLYLLPLILLGTVLSRWQIAVTAALCTGLADLFDPDASVSLTSLAHDIIIFTALAGTAFYAYAATRNRRLERQHLRIVEQEAAARREAEEQLDFLVETSPAAILTMSADGEILLANPSAHRLFRVPPGTLPGRSIRRYVAALDSIPSRAGFSRSVQSEMQCRAERDTGESFLADVFFATYETTAGPRLAALVVDVSEAMREHEISSLEQSMASSRVLVGAVFHEVRNVCSAMAITYENLFPRGQGVPDKDVAALGALVATLRQITSAELKRSAETIATGDVDLAETLTDLRIVLDPYCEQAGIDLRWEIPRALPAVWADRHRLLQVCLNLIRNSERAMAAHDTKRVDISVSVHGAGVSIRVSDTGPGLASSEHLFEPFQRGADASGLGLYLSRALLRSFGGDLRHAPTAAGCAFVIDLPRVPPDERHDEDVDTHGTNPVAAG